MSDTLTAEVAAHYDRSVDAPLATAMREGSLYFNYGYWHDGAISMREASERLMAELVVRAEVQEGASVLDVACGMGATTSYVASHTKAGRIVGINISDRQLEICRNHAPDLEFQNMSAVEMTFGDNSFDQIFCVEAAFHFNTRRNFLAEACRVLKPGGRLVMTDIPNPGLGTDSIPENQIDSLEAYLSLLKGTGFQPVSVADRTEECLGGYVPFVLFFRDTLMQRGDLSHQQFWWLTQRIQSVSQINYVEVVADAT